MAKILIMDDEPGMRNILVSALESAGHSLLESEDGKHALDIARREKPDLALLDMRVPDMDGLEVLSAIKAEKPELPCVMISGFGDAQSAAEAIKKGASDYITKPFKISEVLSVINRALKAG